MRLAILAASIGLSACAAHPQISGLNASLDSMIGQPVEVAVARFGQPIGSAKAGVDWVYGWGFTFSGTEFLHPNPGWIDAAAHRGGVFPPPRRTVQKTCIIRMVVGPTGSIRGWDYQNTDRDCRSYSDQMASLTMGGNG